MVGLWDVEAQFKPIMSTLEGVVYEGHAGLREWLAAVFEDWDVFEAYDDEFREAGDFILSFGRWHACGRSSGIDLNIDTAAWLIRIRNGKVIWWQTFTDRSDALTAAGLSEDAMSPENVEVVQAAFETWNTGNMDALRELYHPDVIVRSPEGWPEPGPFVGRDAVMREFDRLREAWDTDEAEPISDFRAAGDRVAVRLIWHGAGRGPDADLEVTQVNTVRKGKIFAIEYFWDHADALEALGLAE
jgi:ketosteroid isomerase-like protein